MEFVDRVSAYPNRYIMTNENGNVSYVILDRADEPTAPGTPLSAETFNNMILDIRKSMAPVGFTFEWTPVEGGPDLSTAEKVANYYGFGTWEAYGTGRFALGVSDQYRVGSEGGANEIILENNNLPRYAITFVKGKPYEWSVGVWDSYNQTDDWIAKPLSEQQGYSQTAIDNMPPYVTVYRWRRIA